jgi:cell shape-determining protein MreD
MLRGLAWTMQVGALVVVGSALLVGLIYDALRAEVAMLAVGGALFLVGRWLDRREEG